MPKDQNPEGAVETPQTPPQEPKEVVTPATEPTEPQTPPASGEEMVTVPKSKLEHMAVRTRQLRNALYAKNPEAAKQLEDQETRRVKDVLEDMVLGNPAYAQVLSQNQHLRTIVRTNPLSLIPAEEVLYDDEDIREVLTDVLDKEVGKSSKTKVDTTPAPSTVPNTPPAPTPATPPSDATPDEKEKKKEEPSTLASAHREPQKRVEASIAERLRNRK